MVKRLESLDADFKQHHMALIETIEEEEKLTEEQSLLDDHDDRDIGIYGSTPVFARGK